MPPGCPRLVRLVLGLGAVLALGSGCAMQRTLEIDTQPSSARIWVNGALQPTTTPVVVPFTQYGRFDVRVEKEGYRSVATELHIPSQLDGYPLVDLPFEVLGGRRHIRRVVPLEPLAAQATAAEVEATRRRAEAFRERARREAAEPGTPTRQAPPEILR